MDAEERDDVPLVSTEEAIAEVRRWLDVEGVDPEGIFTSSGDQIVRYRDLIAHLEQETPDGNLLRFAISRGRMMKTARRRAQQTLFQIASEPARPGSGGVPPEPEGPVDPTAAE
jgi:hypothetical protein